MRIPLQIIALLSLLPLPAAYGEPPRRTYELDYRVAMQPAEGIATVTVKLAGDRLPSRIIFSVDPERQRNFRGSHVSTAGHEVRWEPQGRSAELEYDFVVNHKHSADSGYDSYMKADWAIFRGDALVPRVRVKAARNLYSRATLRLAAPTGWSMVSALGPTENDTLSFDDPSRRFDRPSGWLLVGKMGRRVERIAGVTTTVAAPLGNDARRQDILAFLNWNLPRLLEVFPKFPQRVLIVSAGDPMWRGGLSGPASLFIHADRPLISENRTSTLLHELVHVAMGIRGAEDSDWIVEGFAEYYSLETLRRSQGVSKQRYEDALQRLERWSRKAPSLRVDRSTGAVTAKAVITLHAANEEIRSLTSGRRSLDDVAAQLANQSHPVTLDDLRRTAREVAGRDLDTLARLQ